MKTNIAICAALVLVMASSVFGGDPKKDQDDFNALKTKYTADKHAILQPKLEVGKYYIIGGTNGVFNVLQVTDEVLFVEDFATDKPWAVLTFQDPSAVSGVQIQVNSRGSAVGKFLKFATIPMADGSEQRFPVFECVGFLLGNQIGYLCTEKK